MRLSPTSEVDRALGPAWGHSVTYVNVVVFVIVVFVTVVVVAVVDDVFAKLRLESGRI